MNSNGKPEIERAPPPVRALHSAAWNYAGHAYQVAISFGLTFYIVRYLAMSEYGLLLFVTSLPATFYLLDMGFSSVLIQAYVSVNKDTDQLNDLLATAFVALTVLGALGAFILIGFAFALPGPFNIPSQYLHDAFILFVIAALVVQIQLPTIAVEQVFQAAHRFDRTNQIRLIESTVQLVLTIAVLVAGYRIVALAAVQLATTAVQMLLLLITLPSSVPGAKLRLRPFRWDLLRQVTTISKWAFLQNISSSLVDFLGLAILASLGSMNEVALFGFASKLPKQLWALIDKGTTVLLPYLSRFSADTDLPRLRNTYLMEQTLLVGGALPFILLGTIFAHPLLQVWAGERYSASAVVMRWLLLASFAQIVAYPSDELLYACKMVKTSAVIFVAIGVVAITAGSLLIPRYGAVGLAAGFAFARLAVGCGWLIAAGSKASRTAPGSVLKAAFRGVVGPLSALLLAIALVWRFKANLPAVAMVLSAIACGCLYLALWARFTAVPLFRERAEVEQ